MPPDTQQKPRQEFLPRNATNTGVWVERTLLSAVFDLALFLELREHHHRRQHRGRAVLHRRVNQLLGKNSHLLLLGITSIVI